MKKFIFSCVMTAFSSISAFAETPVAAAAGDLGAIIVDTQQVLTAAGVIITGLATMWGIRKVIKTINRS